MKRKPPESRLSELLRRSAIAQAGALSLAALLLRLLHVRFAATSPLFHAPTADEWENWSFAAQLAAGNWLGEGLGPYFRPQFFAYTLALLQKLTGGSILLCHLVLVVIDAATVGVAYLVARRIWPRGPSVLAALALAVYSPALHFAATFNKESFGIHLQAWLLLFALLWIRGAARRRSPGKWAAGTGLAAGLGLLTRPALLLPGVLLLSAIARATLCRKRLVQSALPLLAATGLTLVLLAVAAVRNFSVGGAPILYSTNGWLNLYLANNSEGVSWVRHSPGVAWDLLVERPLIEAGISQKDYRGIDRFWRDRLLDGARRKPLDLVRGLVCKTGMALHAREVGAVANLAESRRLSPVQNWAPGAGVLFPIALAGLLLVPFRRPRSRIRSLSRGMLVLVAVGALISIALVHPTARDRLALSAVLLLFTAEAALQIRSVMRSQQWRGLAARLALVVFTSIAVNWPVQAGELERFETWSTAINRGDAHLMLWNTYRQPSDLPAAITAYEEALSLRPEGLQPLKQLPAALVRSGQPEAAVRYQEQLVARLRSEWPKNRLVRARELEVLTQLALRTGQSAAAEPAAREWRELDPESVKALDALVVSLILQQKRQPALDLALERQRRLPDAEASALIQRARALK